MHVCIAWGLTLEASTRALLPRTYRKPADLPAAIPVFPLGGALLFPRASLPLNIFEPRYLAMVDAALASHRLIGMIQPAAMFGPNAPLDDDRPPLSRVGCAGRITAFQETGDGRYLIVLTGIMRFEAGEDLAAGAPYRLVRANWTPSPTTSSHDAALDDSCARAVCMGALETLSSPRRLQGRLGRSRISAARCADQLARRRLPLYEFREAGAA